MILFGSESSYELTELELTQGAAISNEMLLYWNELIDIKNKRKQGQSFSQIHSE